jgi:hypothetical protein
MKPRGPYIPSRELPAHDGEHRRTMLFVGVFLAFFAAASSMLPVSLKLRFHTKGHLHPWLHFLTFAVLGALALLSTRRARTRLLLVVAVIALGLTIEYTEAWRFTSPLEVSDIFTDIGGTLAGSLVAWFLSLTEN